MQILSRTRSVSRPLHRAAQLLRHVRYTESISLLPNITMAAATDPSKYKLNHSMIRVKDPKRSVEFYGFLGLKVINTLKNPQAKFDLFFLAYDSPHAVSHGNHWSDREGIVELTHNYGTEDDPDYKVTTGNSEPHRGFGHLCISVDNIQAACKRIEDAGYRFQKKVKCQVNAIL
jgi:lactoylglutathione lyase